MAPACAVVIATTWSVVSAPTCSPVSAANASLEIAWMAAVEKAALCAVFPDSRNPFAFPHLLQAEGLEPWTVPEVWLFGGGDGARVVDITDQLDRKLRALRAHESQHEDQDEIASFVAEWGRTIGAQYGLGDGRAGEAFLVVDTG